jgi:hypothetical protein
MVVVVAVHVRDAAIIRLYGGGGGVGCTCRYIIVSRKKGGIKNKTYQACCCRHPVIIVGCYSGGATSMLFKFVVGIG